MQLSKGARTMGRVGACVASAASMLVLAGSASAAGDTTRSYEHGHEIFTVQLTGDEVRDGGDRDGNAVARLDLDPENERVCYVITWRGLDGDVTDFHIHAAPRRSDGPVFVDLFNDRHFDGDRNTVADCVHSDRSKIRDIIDDPSDYYLMLHTTPHHAGALRGQLD
ncbi:MAG: CHRD domain-containing protein [Pseudonocardiaceae bacterium]